MVTMSINGKIVTAEEGEMLLAVIRRQGIEIPALCNHDAVEPFGACRLCMVEITREEWDGWKKHVTSCLYPVEDGLIVQTHTDKVIELRKSVLDLQLAACPTSPEIQQLAAEYGVTRTSFEEVPESDNCILCGLCTRICAAMGFHAISTVGRGHEKVVAPPLKEAPPDCVGCLACSMNCPTNIIPYTDEGNTRTIWNRTFERIECKECGKLTITREFADALIARRGLGEDYFDTCDQCRRKETALTMGRISQWEREVQS